MLARETARAAWKLFQEHVGEGLPVSAVIYSHSHVDHWGGVRGIVDEADVRAGKIEIRCEQTAEALDEYYGAELMELLEMRTGNAYFDDYGTLINLVE